jgi:integrase
MPKLSKQKITKRTVDALRADPNGADLFIWDDELRGFGVRMKASGTASYLVQYRTAEGRTRRLAIAKVGTLTPEEARKLALRKLSEVEKGGDPSAERRQLRDSMTVGELCDLYLSDAAGRVKASTLGMDKSRIESHVKPLIGRRVITTLTRDDVERMQAEIVAGKTARPPSRDAEGKRIGRGGVRTGGRGVAARTVGMLGTILELARRRGLVSQNPARGVTRQADGKQRRFLSFGEMAEMGRVMMALEAEGENAASLAAIRLLLLTGLRRMEALALRRDWVDVRSRCIRFEDTKSGAQLRPIGREALKVIDQQPRRDGCPWVFPASRGEGHFVGLPKVLARICKKAKVEGVTLHVLRHSFASAAAEMGYSELTIAGLLGHSVPGVTARYAHVPDAALTAAADRVATRIASALAGASAGADVVPLPTRGTL